MRIIEKGSVKTVVPRSYDPPVNIAGHGITFIEAHKRFGNSMLTNKELDRVLLETDIWTTVTAAMATHSKTILGYTQPGKPMGSIIESMDDTSDFCGVEYIDRLWTLLVPKELRELKDVALVTENYELEVDNKRVVIHPKDKISVVENFPTEWGWYGYDESTGIPINVKKDESDGDAARFLLRTSQRVGPIARGNLRYYLDYYSRRNINVSSPQSYLFGVLALNDCPEVAEAAKQAAISMIGLSAPYMIRDVRLRR